MTTGTTPQLAADVEVRRLRAEHVLAHTRRVLDTHLEGARRAGCLHSAVLGAERAGARPGGIFVGSDFQSSVKEMFPQWQFR